MSSCYSVLFKVALDGTNSAKATKFTETGYVGRDADEAQLLAVKAAFSLLFALPLQQLHDLNRLQTSAVWTFAHFLSWKGSSYSKKAGVPYNG